MIKGIPEFIKTDLRSLLVKLGIQIEEELPIMAGAARILRCLTKRHTNEKSQKPGD